MPSNHDHTPHGLSRRGFLKTVGAGTVAGGIATGGATGATASAQAETAAPSLVGPNEVPLTLNVHGHDHAISVEPRVLLLDALRHRLDLAGAKKVWHRAACRPCRSLVLGELVYSCSMLALEAEGRKITSV